MFRLAVADPENAVISINVSALSRHRFGSTLHASLEPFIWGSPMDYLHQMSRMDDSEECALNLVYYSTLLHELRHFFDFVISPYGAFTLRSAMTNYQIVLGLLLEGQPVIIPFISGSDPVIGKYQLGLQDFATTPSCAAGRMIREQQKVFVGDRRGLRHENGRVVHFG